MLPVTLFSLTILAGGAVLTHLLIDEHIGDRHSPRSVCAAGGFKTIGMIFLGEIAAKALKINDREIRAQA